MITFHARRNPKLDETNEEEDDEDDEVEEEDEDEDEDEEEGTTTCSLEDESTDWDSEQIKARKELGKKEKSASSIGSVSSEAWRGEGRENEEDDQ